MENNVKKDYTKYNADNVLKKVNYYIDLLEKKKYKQLYDIAHFPYNKILIRKVCDDLSIFDWWKETLSVSNLKDMRKFLKEAIKLGFTGNVCFKVGVSGCANGMWAHVEESKDGYSPDCDFLYKSFTPEYNCWDFSINGKLATKEYFKNIGWGEIKTIKQLETCLKEVRMGGDK